MVNQRRLQQVGALRTNAKKVGVKWASRKLSLNLLDTNRPIPCNGKFDTKPGADSHPAGFMDTISKSLRRPLPRKVAVGALAARRRRRLSFGAGSENQYRTPRLRKRPGGPIAPSRPSRPARTRSRTEGSKDQRIEANGRDGSATCVQESFVSHQHGALLGAFRICE